MIPTIQGSMMDNDFIGVKLGDVDGSLILEFSDQQLTTRSVYDIHYSLESKSKEHEQLIPIFSSDLDMIYGFQFALALNQGKIIDVLPGSADIQKEHFFIMDDKTVALSWNGEEGALSNQSIPLFYLSVEGINRSTIELALMKDIPSAEMYISDQLITKIPALSLYEEGEVYGEFALHQNDPNPFKEWTEIGFYLPVDQDVNVSFYTPDGSLIHSIDGYYNKGLNSVRIEASDLGVQNVVIYRLSSDFYTASKKMILVK